MQSIKDMSKRSKQKFERVSRDFYGTIDPDATKPLVKHFINGYKVAEVCAGKGDLTLLLEPECSVVWESDIQPQTKFIKQKDALTLTKDDLYEADVIVTNPPYLWGMLQPLLEHLPTLKPTWLLLPADVAHNKRMGQYIVRCSDIVSVGRLYWVENRVKGTDNMAWFCFHDKVQQETKFYGRAG